MVTQKNAHPMKMTIEIRSLLDVDVSALQDANVIKINVRGRERKRVCVCERERESARERENVWEEKSERE